MATRSPPRGSSSARDLLDAEWDPPEVERPQVEVLRRLVDVDADRVTICVDVDHDAVADLPRVHAGALGEIDVQAVRVWEVLDPHGLNLRSGNACSLRTGFWTTRMHISR